MSEHMNKTSIEQTLQKLFHAPFDLLDHLSSSFAQHMVSTKPVQEKIQKLTAEAERLCHLVVDQNMSPEQALATVQDEDVRNMVRTTLYVGLIASYIEVMRTEHLITDEQAADYRAFLVHLRPSNLRMK